MASKDAFRIDKFLHLKPQPGRPADVINGLILYNESNGQFEMYEDGQWRSLTPKDFNDILTTDSGGVVVSNAGNIVEKS